MRLSKTQVYLKENLIYNAFAFQLKRKDVWNKTQRCFEMNVLAFFKALFARFYTSISR